MSDYMLKLYVTGRSPRSERAMANLRRICEIGLCGDCQLEIVDVLEHPERAEEAKILATPTLIKEAPWPLKRIIGDLSDTSKVLSGLGMQLSDDSAHSGEKDGTDGHVG